MLPDHLEYLVESDANDDRDDQKQNRCSDEIPFVVVVSLLLLVTSALCEIDPSHHTEQEYRGDDRQVGVDFLPDEQSDLLLLDELCIVLIIVLDQLAQSDHGT